MYKKRVKPVVDLEKKYTTKELADICGVSITSINNWINKGIIPCERTYGGHRRISQSDMEKMKELCKSSNEEYLRRIKHEKNKRIL